MGAPDKVPSGADQKRQSAMAKLKGAMRRLKPTPGDAKADLLVVIASRLIMNDGNGVAASDVVNAVKVPPANEWARRHFGEGVTVTSDIVEKALNQAKDHFTRGADGKYTMKGWPLARKKECRIGASFEVDERLAVPGEAEAATNNTGLRGKGGGGGAGGGSTGYTTGKQSGGGGGGGGGGSGETETVGEKRKKKASDDVDGGDDRGARSSKEVVGSAPLADGTSGWALPVLSGGAAAVLSGGGGGTGGSALDLKEKTPSSRRLKKKGKSKPATPTPAAAAPAVQTAPAITTTTVAAAGPSKPHPQASPKKAPPARSPPPRAPPPAPPSRPRPPPSPTPSPAPSSEPDVDPGNVAMNIKFTGALRKGTVYANRTYYTAFTVITNKAGELHKASYKIGDHVFALPGSAEEDMYLAQIDGIFEDDEGQYVDCIWLERAKDVEAMVGARTWKDVKHKLLPGEVFLCTTVNTNPIQSIEGHAKIMSLEEYEAQSSKKKQGGGSAAGGKGEKGLDEVFVCRRALILKQTGRKKTSGASFAPVRRDEKRGFVVPEPPPKHKGRKSGGR